MTFGSLMHSWKGFSSRQINARMDRTGTLWQKSYFNRMIRDWDHFANSAQYIRNNPIKAKLRAGEAMQRRISICQSDAWSGFLRGAMISCAGGLKPPVPVIWRL